MQNFAHFKVSQLTSSMTAAHFPFSPFYNPLLFQTSSSHNQLSYFLVFSVRNSVKQSILHLFICILLLSNSQLFLRQDALMKGIAGNFELGSDSVKAVDEGIHVEFLPAFLAFPHDSVEHLAFAQTLEDECFLDVDSLEVECVFVISLHYLQTKSKLHDIIFYLFEDIVDNCTRLLGGCDQGVNQQAQFCQPTLFLLAERIHLAIFDLYCIASDHLSVEFVVNNVDVGSHCSLRAQDDIFRSHQRLEISCFVLQIQCVDNLCSQFQTHEYILLQCSAKI